MKNAIEIKDLEKKYDKFELGKISLDIPSGLIVGLIGENGAGKTTLIKSILNIIKIDNGSIKIFDKDFRIQENKIKEDIGVVLDNTFFPEILTPNDVNGIMKDIYKNWDQDLYFKYMKDFDLPFDKVIKSFSKGMRKKLEIATALSHHPKLLILDEPTSGLDPVVRNEVLDIFMNFIQDEEHTVGKRISSDNIELDSSCSYNSEHEKIEDSEKHTFKVVGMIERPDYTFENTGDPGYTMITTNLNRGKTEAYLS